jgi:prefoldin subunit 5
LTYAEVKAIASGNPMVIEKANVDAELARFTRLRTQHRETGFRIRNQVRHLSEEIPRLERRLTALDADITRCQNTRGDRFTITLGTQELTDRGIAGEMLIRVAERSKGLTAERRLGTFAGFDLLIGPLPSGETELLLRGNATHTCRVQATAHGTTRALEHILNNLEDTRTQMADHLVQLQRRLGDLRVQMDVPFEHAARLGELEARQKELVDALDLSRHASTPERIQTLGKALLEGDLRMDHAGSDELARQHAGMAGASSGSAPGTGMGADSSQRGGEHGLRRRARSLGLDLGAP